MALITRTQVQQYGEPLYEDDELRVPYTSDRTVLAEELVEYYSLIKLGLRNSRPDLVVRMYCINPKVMSNCF